MEGTPYRTVGVGDTVLEKQQHQHREPDKGMPFIIRENLRMSLQEPSPDFSTPQSPRHPARKRPVSERRIQANRQNALRSTGPKTARGKRNVSRNAIKHGILAREVVITAGDGEETLKEFHDLAEKLCELYEPV